MTAGRGPLVAREDGVGVRPPPEEPGLPPEAFLAALARLPNMWPRRLLVITLVYEPAAAWAAIVDGSVLRRASVVEQLGADARGLVEGWRRVASEVDVATHWAAQASVLVRGRSHPDYPAALADDIEPPAVVFMQGDPQALDGPRVAVVGTRRCTRAGAEIARELGRDLAAAGVRVVSGLALGIDGAAHRGALDAGPSGAPPIGVVACGLDVVYPKRHRDLWNEVVDAGGLMISEYPLGSDPITWRFPARNRIIAALAAVVVVVESRASGGSLITADLALDRGIKVVAFPGSVRSPASEGTNQRLFEGTAELVRDSSDVLALLGLAGPQERAADPRPKPSVHGRLVLDALGWEPAALETLAVRTELDFGPLSLAVAELEAGGWIAPQGLWIERVARP